MAERSILSESETQALVHAVEAMLDNLEALPADERETAFDAVQALLELYGEAWKRVVIRLEQSTDANTRGVLDDALVKHLLMIHGLQPLDPRLEDRVEPPPRLVQLEMRARNAVGVGS